MVCNPINSARSVVLGGIHSRAGAVELIAEEIVGASHRVLRAEAVGEVEVPLAVVVARGEELPTGVQFFWMISDESGYAQR